MASSTGVEGFNARPTFLPCSWIAAMQAPGSLVASMWKVMMSAPAAAIRSISLHQVHVKDQVGLLPDTADHRHAERQVRDENAVHDVDMHILRAGFLRERNLLTEPVEIRGQD